MTIGYNRLGSNGRFANQMFQYAGLRGVAANKGYGLSFENGCSTITNFTGYLIAKGIESMSNNIKIKYLICGGGRKNNSLINCIKNNLNNKNNFILENIDKYGFNGDYIESQAFGYLAIKSFLNLPISFPNTTGCASPTVGGIVVKNF